MKKLSVPQDSIDQVPARTSDFGAYNRQIDSCSRLVNSSEEGTKRPLRRFREAVSELRTSQNDLGKLSACLDRIEREAATLLEFDSSLRWGLGLVVPACEALRTAMRGEKTVEDDVPTDDVTVSMLSAYRVTLLDLVDELATRVRAFGDHLNGGMEEREPLLAKVAELRKACGAKEPDADPQPYVDLVLQVKSLCREQSQLRSKLTGEGFNFRPLEANLASCDKIIQSLERRTVQPVRTLVPVTSSRQTPSYPLKRGFAWEAL